MKKILFLFLCLFAFANSSPIENKIINFIGLNEYNKNKNIINVLFKDTNKFYSGGELNVVAVLEELKNNGLLKLHFANPKDFVLEFETTHIALGNLYIINNILNAMGYHYYFTKGIEKDSQLNMMKLDVVLNTEYIVDPILLSLELQKRNIRVKDIIQHSPDKWTYKIDMKNASVNDIIKISTNEKVSLQKPLKPYMIQISEAKEINITSNRLDTWFPYIVFYDENFSPIYTVSQKTIYSGLKSAIPNGTKYIQIGDLYNLVNIKRGLTLVIKG
jgi:hypothetical protein